jgi:membrane-anchored mycosin MYCP
VAGAAVLVAMLPAVAPAGLAPVAAAQQPAAATFTADQARPPALDMGALPAPQPGGQVPPYVAGDQDGPPTVSNNLACVSGDSHLSKLDAIPWAQTRLRLGELGAFATGAGQLVAVIDTGVKPHNLLGKRLIAGGDYVTGQDALSDCDGHGTLVAGLIGARADAGGFAGIAPDAQIMAIRQDSSFLQYKVRAAAGTTSNATRAVGDVHSLALAVRYAADHHASVINISEAACFAPRSGDAAAGQDLQAALHYAVTQLNAVVVAAAGNVDQNGNCRTPNAPDAITEIPSPAWYDDVLSVGAMDQTGAAAGFSLGGPWVDIAAPGTEIASIDPTNPAGLVNQTIDATTRGVSSIQGTSFAAPYVAGVAALVRQRYPQLTARQVMDRLEQTAQHPAGAGGRGDALGYGMVDPVAALTAVLPSEHGQSAPADNPASVTGLSAPQAPDVRPRTIALIGSATAVLLIGGTWFVVFSINRSRRRGRSPMATAQQR